MEFSENQDWKPRDQKTKELSPEELAAFEQKLRIAMRYRAAPVGLRTRVLARARERRLARHGWAWMGQRMAASILLAAAVSGIAVYHEHEVRREERRKGELAREQVLTAFRITGRTLDRVNQRLAESSR